MPSAPLGVPDDDAPGPAEVPATQVEEPPAQSIVGDRYSDNEDILDPPSTETPADLDSTPNPTTDSTAEPGGKDDADIFGEPSPPEADASPAESDLPEPKSPTPPSSDPESQLESKPEPPPEAESDALDIFSATEPAVSAPDEVKLIDPTPSTEDLEPTVEDDYDPFGKVSPQPGNELKVLESAGGLLSERQRTWTDNTGTFECQARLIHVCSQRVTLQKSFGTKVNVPLARLATADLQFVQQQISALRIVRARDTAVEKLAVAWGD